MQAILPSTVVLLLIVLLLVWSILGSSGVQLTDVAR